MRRAIEALIFLALFMTGCTEQVVKSYNFMHCVKIEDDEKGLVGICWLDEGTQV